MGDEKMFEFHYVLYNNRQAAKEFYHDLYELYKNADYYDMAILSLAYPISGIKNGIPSQNGEIKSFYLNDGCLHITGSIMDSSHCELIENIVEHAYSGLRYVYKAEDDKSRIYINTDTIRAHIKLALMVEIKDEMSAYTNEQQAIKGTNYVLNTSFLNLDEIKHYCFSNGIHFCVYPYVDADGIPHWIEYNQRYLDQAIYSIYNGSKLIDVTTDISLYKNGERIVCASLAPLSAIYEIRQADIKVVIKENGKIVMKPCGLMGDKMIQEDITTQARVFFLSSKELDLLTRDLRANYVYICLTP